ncbi:phage-related membrane protein [Pandoraea anapnoica]|uniref:Phage-related membrane protein n=1 Tax=Pandoraea anapnoica TaxID=2508301 RepID=A0A5E5APH2_9BURK|nr:hypothetical protein [Pandoraea anapnoica]VVE74010.1 phage-related membrane protein [Pandoraea anapnoica]
MKEKLERLKAIGGRAGVAAVMIATPFAAHAEAGGGTGGVDLSAMTNAISFTNVGLAVVSVGASLALVYVGVKGAKIVLGFIRG